MSYGYLDSDCLNYYDRDSCPTSECKWNLEKCYPKSMRVKKGLLGMKKINSDKPSYDRKYELMNDINSLNKTLIKNKELFKKMKASHRQIPPRLLQVTKVLLEQKKIYEATLNREFPDVASLVISDNEFMVNELENATTRPGRGRKKKTKRKSNSKKGKRSRRRTIRRVKKKRKRRSSRR